MFCLDRLEDVLENDDGHRCSKERGIVTESKDIYRKLRTRIRKQGPQHQHQAIMLEHSARARWETQGLI